MFMKIVNYCGTKYLCHNGEGIIAKKSTSKWSSDKRTEQLVENKKLENVTVILIKYDKGNGYFHGAVYDEEHW